MAVSRAAFCAVALAIGGAACLAELPRNPNHVCAIDEVQALPAEGFTETSDDCTACLETPCCDAIGNCDGDCRAKVKAAHACVLRSGPLHEARDEKTCLDTNKVTGDVAASNAYRCMRDTCGTQCALPVCKVDPSYGLFLNVSCDECLSSSCCPQLNACAQDRGCKLLTDCIVQNCKSLFGTRTASLTPETVGAVRDAICNDKPLPASDAGRDCVADCFDSVEPTGPAAVGEGPSSACIGFDVVACAVAADCTAACTPPDAGF